MQISLYVLILIVSGLISTSLAIYGFRRYSEPEMAAFGYLMVSIAIWVFGAAGETAFSSMGIRLFWTIISYAGCQPSPVFLLIFIMLLTRSATWFPEKYYPILFIIPACSILMAGTNAMHYLLWTNIYEVQTLYAGTSLFFEHGPWFSVLVVYTYLIISIAFICLIKRIFSTQGVFNRQMTIILFATLIPIIGNILYTYSGALFSGIDLTPVLFTCTGVLCWYAISRHGLFDIFPALYEQIFNNMQEGIIVLDSKHRIISINPSAGALINLSESVIGKEAKSVFENWPEIDRVLSEYDLDFEVRGIDEQWFHVRVYSIPSGYSGKDGRLIIIRNITSRKQLQEDLEKTTENIRRANVKLNLMAGIVRHDIANELMVIQSTFDMILPPPPINSTERLFYDRSKEATNNIRELIRFTREYEEMGVRKPEWFDLHKIVEEEGLNAAAKIVFENSIAPGTMVYTDPLIRIVIHNLIDNALRHGENVRKIRFYIDHDSSGASLFCEDNGKGVANEEKEKIFEKGYGSNTGMGLYLIKEILSVGDMTIKETGKEGEGARFVIHIPGDLIRWDENEQKTVKL